MTTPPFFSGTGRRKTAVARVRLLPGEGQIVVNGRTLTEHFGNAINEADVRLPFRVTGNDAGARPVGGVIAWCTGGPCGRA